MYVYLSTYTYIEYNVWYGVYWLSLVDDQNRKQKHTHTHKKHIIQHFPYFIWTCLEKLWEIVKYHPRLQGKSHD